MIISRASSKPLNTELDKNNNLVPAGTIVGAAAQRFIYLPLVRR